MSPFRPTVSTAATGQSTAPAIICIIVALCRLMKLKVVAEGVETESQLAWVRDQRIEEYQGYFYSKPVPPDDFLPLLTGNTH